MRLHFLLLLLSLASVKVTGQDKWNYSTHNNFIELKDTEYIVAFIEHNSKLSVKNKELLFINVLTGETSNVVFPKGTYIKNMEHIKIDSLGINKVILTGRLVNLDDSKKIGWNDPKQIIISSVDGKTQTQITDDNFFVGYYVVNKKFGVIAISGYQDNNNNCKYDKGDKPEILLYSLKEMKLIKRIDIHD